MSQAFDELFSRPTGYEELDHRIELTGKKKKELVLEFPQVPIENNEAEREIREFVIKKKISKWDSHR
ncbi:MAG: transposase [Fidelibacterota bacterium]